MDDYAGRVLADRYRLPLPPSDEYELTETRAFDTYSGQEVLVRQVPLPEVVEAEVLDAEGLPDGFTARDAGARHPARRPAGRRGGPRRPADLVVRRAVEAAQAAARVPDHPRLDQVFDVFAEDGSLWIVSEHVAARPLAALLAEEPLTPYRAAEVASDVLMALRVLHGHGWVHRNITARTVLVCDDGRVMLTGLAVGAAEEALCGYDPVPGPEAGPGGPGRPGEEPGGGPYGGDADGGPGGTAWAGDPGDPGDSGHLGEPDGFVEFDGPPAGFGGFVGSGEFGGFGEFGELGESPVPAGAWGASADPEAARRAAIQARAAGATPAPGAAGPRDAAAGQASGSPFGAGGDIRAARAGAIAAYRAGARAAARVQEAENGRAALPGARPAPDAHPAPYTGEPGRSVRGVRPVPDEGSGPGPVPGTEGASRSVPGARDGVEAGTAPGRFTDPYGAGTSPWPWHGAAPRTPHGAQAPFPSGPPAPEAPTAPLPSLPSGGWGDPAAGLAARRGPSTALAAERARQTRMAVVGPVTERWAPEQAGPVHENWRLAPPIGPATDLWALGALLFRAVQGHAPYPEESTAELVQMVCAEPPAFAEECGALRPVVESLLRQDPTERIDVEELGGWLRSLVRSAPEPDAGAHIVAAPPADTGRLPVVRRRGELVRRRRAGLPTHQGRHKRTRQESGSPRRLGRLLLLLVLLGMALAIAYAMLFMPKAGPDGAAPADRTGAAGEVSEAPPPSSDTGSDPRPDQKTSGGGEGPTESAASTEAQTTGAEVADGFVLRTDPEGFRVAVAEGWKRAPATGSGQIVYSRGDFELLVVPGRDSAVDYGSDPMAYQRDSERELQPYRDSTWATSTGLKRIEVGGRIMAEGQFTWTDPRGRELYVRNLALLIDGRYHVVQVRGPEAERDEVTRLYEQASATYTYTG